MFVFLSVSVSVWDSMQNRKSEKNRIVPEFHKQAPHSVEKTVDGRFSKLYNFRHKGGRKNAGAYLSKMEKPHYKAPAYYKIRKSERTAVFMKRTWTKSLVLALALLMAVSMAAANPMPAQAAAKKMTVKVASQKKKAAISGKTLNILAKTSVKLAVKSPVTKAGKKTVVKDVTAKAKYKTSNKKVVSVSGKGVVTAKKNGTSTLTVKYGGKALKLKVKVNMNHKHNWKAHKKTVTVRKEIARCNCGAILPELEKKDCDFCKKNNLICADYGYCCCKQRAHARQHIKNGEPDNYWYEYKYQKVKYVDHYTCGCGMTKAGEPKPKDD